MEEENPPPVRELRCAVAGNRQVLYLGKHAKAITLKSGVVPPVKVRKIRMGNKHEIINY